MSTDRYLAAAQASWAPLQQQQHQQQHQQHQYPSYPSANVPPLQQHVQQQQHPSMQQQAQPLQHQGQWQQPQQQLQQQPVDWHQQPQQQVQPSQQMVSPQQHVPLQQPVQHQMPQQQPQLHQPPQHRSQLPMPTQQPQVQAYQQHQKPQEPVPQPKTELTPAVASAPGTSLSANGCPPATALAGQTHFGAPSPATPQAMISSSQTAATPVAATVPAASQQLPPLQQQKPSPPQPSQQPLYPAQQLPQQVARNHQQHPASPQQPQPPSQQQLPAVSQQPYQYSRGHQAFTPQHQQQQQQPVGAQAPQGFASAPQPLYPPHSGGAPLHQEQQQQQQQPQQQQQQQIYGGSVRGFPQQQQQVHQQHRLPSLVGVGTETFPLSGSVNGARASQGKGDQQQQQQQQQLQQEDTTPDDMPALQPLVRPINNRIDPAHIPRPEWNEQMTHVCGKRIETDKSGASPPSPAGFYTAVDKGCCSCRFMRSTLNQVPAFSHSLELSRLPFALVVTPFAAQPPTEEPVPLVDLRLRSHSSDVAHAYQDKSASAAADKGGSNDAAQEEFYGGYFELEDSEAEEDAATRSGSRGAATSSYGSSSATSPTGQQRAASSEGIVRCSNCMAYISPFMAWASNSTHCVCNLCGTSFELPQFYLALLDQYRSGWHGGSSGLAAEVDRHNASQRLELWRGSVDFVAPKAFAAASKLAQAHSKRRAHLRWLHRVQHECRRQHQLRQQHQQHLEEQHQQQEQLDRMQVPGMQQQQQQQQQQHEQQQQSSQATWGSPQPTASGFDGDYGQAPSSSSTSSSSSSMRPCIVFVVDVTAASLTSGLAQAFATAMQQVLQEVSLQIDICIILVADRLYFIPNHRQEGQEQQQQQQQGLRLLVVNDISNPFLPAPLEHCFFRPEDREQLLWAVSMLPSALNTCINVSQTSAANAGLKVAVDLIAERSVGGMVEVFYATLPDIGVGALQHSTASSQERTKTTEIHQQDFYNSIITSCFAASACVDVFACPSPNLRLELQSLGYPAQQTGGDIRFVPEFCGSRDKEWVTAEIRRIFTSCFYFDVEFKLRLSKGLSVDRILVSFSGARSLVDQGTFRLPRLSPQSTLLFQLKHTEQLESQKNVYAQSVCAYTPMHPSKKVPNRRLLRVHSLSLPLTFSLASLFRYAEVDATAFLMARSCAKMELHQEPQWREKTIKHLVEILSAYRINCASASSEGQLILPDSLKLLPIYLQALFKHVAFRQSTVDPQVRLFELLQFLRMSITEFSTHLYPRLCLLHKSYIQPPSARERKALERMGEYSGIGDFVWMPLSLPASGTNILSDGVYLCEAGSYVLLYIGQHVRREYIIDLFGFDAKLDERTAADFRLQNTEGSAARILRVVEQIRFEKFGSHFIPLRIVVPKSSDETRLLTHLIEDPLSGDGSYVDFLCDLHKRVHALMEDN